MRRFTGANTFATNYRALGLMFLSIIRTSVLAMRYAQRRLVHDGVQEVNLFLCASCC